jgi:cobalamin biosynthesis Mg chelatase CobN
LTTAAVDRATEAFRRDMDALRELLETRLDSMDKATELLAATLNHVPTETDKAVGALRELLGARIDGMDTATKLLADQLNQIPSATDKRISALREIMLGEIRSVESVAAEKFAAIDGTFGSNALALTAALAAQKEAAAEQNKSNTLAINKSEAATKETVAANAAQAASEQASAAREVADLKERLVRLEERGLAGVASASEQRAARGESRESINTRLIILGVVVSVVIILVNVVIAIIIHK